ncbi:hypothetical protein C7M84_012801 [Penaeus vannamei]|uniref:Uncharacterized protein n=1 Tax=Penaeus vannamei TaxID=6689 RepID=A0A3R7MSY5_PENVA|nr:hypothetical protein C7M84_012801 [Penaeus vannamei]
MNNHCKLEKNTTTTTLPHSLPSSLLPPPPHLLLSPPFFPFPLTSSLNLLPLSSPPVALQPRESGPSARPPNASLVHARRDRLSRPCCGPERLSFLPRHLAPRPSLSCTSRVTPRYCVMTSSNCTFIFLILLFSWFPRNVSQTSSSPLGSLVGSYGLASSCSWASPSLSPSAPLCAPRDHRGKGRGSRGRGEKGVSRSGALPKLDLPTDQVCTRKIRMSRGGTRARLSDGSFSTCPGDFVLPFPLLAPLLHRLREGRSQPSAFSYLRLSPPLPRLDLGSGSSPLSLPSLIPFPLPPRSASSRPLLKGAGGPRWRMGVSSSGRSVLSVPKGGDLPTGTSVPDPPVIPTFFLCPPCSRPPSSHAASPAARPGPLGVAECLAVFLRACRSPSRALSDLCSPAPSQNSTLLVCRYVLSLSLVSLCDVCILSHLLSLLSLITTHLCVLTALVHYSSPFPPIIPPVIDLSLSLTRHSFWLSRHQSSHRLSLSLYI